LSEPGRWNRSFDIALGLSALSWAVLGVVGVDSELRPLSVRLALATLNLVVGALFLTRRDALASGGWTSIAAALPSMVLGAVAIRMVEGEWPAVGQGLFVLGALGACLSLTTLGRSFAFLPSRRELVVRGPYRLVRHPAYACELVMLAGCAAAAPMRVLPLAIGVALTLVWRIQAEEQVLGDDEGWSSYRDQVRWRLVPGLY
jgi:protein-S-isoprenylcysteine O-methyltransferase Ste14